MEPSLVLLGGTVLTMEDAQPEAEAIAIAGDRILAVGAFDDVGGMAGRQTRVLDLGGRTVVPGFIDAHCHLLREGGRLSWVDLEGTPSVQRLRDRLATEAQGIATGKWVLGKGWDESPWQPRAYPCRADLDAACPNHPTLIVRVDGHVGVVNSQGLAALSLPHALPGMILQDGRPTGVLVEEALRRAREAVRAGEDALPGEFPRMVHLALSRGVASVHDVVTLEDIALYGRARDEGLLTLRATLLPIDRASAPPPASVLEDDYLQMGPLKIFADGSLGARTAALHEDYADQAGDRGMLVHSSEDLEERIAGAHARGRPTAIHAIGDRGIETVLDAYEAAGTMVGDRMEHYELPSPADLDRTAALGVSVSMQPNFVGRWGLPGGMYEDRLGGARARAMNPFRRILAADVPLLFGSDGMPLSPLFGLHWAVNAPQDEQKLSVVEALRAYTRTPAEVAGDGALKGTIAPGKVADLVVLSEDPRVAPDAIADLQVVATLVGGRVRYGSLDTGKR